MTPYSSKDHTIWLAKWDLLEPEPLADTPTSVVWKVRQKNSELAVLKLLKPLGIPQEVHGADFLQWRDGKGCARLLERGNSVFLIEYVGKTTLFDHLIATDDKEATAIICDVVSRLHAGAVLNPPSGLPTLEEHFAALFKLAASDVTSEHSRLFRQGAGLVSKLAQEQVDIRPLHGDIHHLNIIKSQNRGWLAIDPASLVADPAYEVANTFGNPHGHEDIYSSPDRIHNLADSFSQLLSCSKTKILQYAFAHSCLSASWSIEDGNDPLPRLKQAEILLEMI